MDSDYFNFSKISNIIRNILRKDTFEKMSKYTNVKLIQFIKETENDEFSRGVCKKIKSILGGIDIHNIYDYLYFP
jgi:hypothetical protein